VNGLGRNFCCHFTQILFSASFLSKNIKIDINRILSVVWYGCETWSETLTQERRLRVFENRVLRRRFGAKMDEVTEEVEKTTQKGTLCSVLLTRCYSIK